MIRASILTPREHARHRLQRVMRIPTMLSGRKFAPHLFKRHRLNQYTPRPAQRRQKQAFPTEQRRLNSTDKFDVVFHCFIESNNAANADLQARLLALFGRSYAWRTS